MRHADSWRAHSENKNNHVCCEDEIIKMDRKCAILTRPFEELGHFCLCLSHSYQTLQPALPVQRDAGCGLHAESGPGRHALLIQGPSQRVCAWGVRGEWS